MRFRRLCILLCLTSTFVFAATPTVRVLRERALAAFKAKKFELACSLWEQAAERDASNGEIWVDLALCHQRRSDNDLARFANVKAASLKSKKARLAAYFNLAQMKAELDPQRVEKVDSMHNIHTEIWSSSSDDCWQPVHVQRFEKYMGGTGVIDDVGGFRFCDSAEKAKDEDLPKTGCHEVILNSLFENKCRPGDVGGAEYGSSPCPDGDAGKKCQRAVAECKKNALMAPPVKIDCHFVFADGCNRRVGAVCDHKAREFSY